MPYYFNLNVEDSYVPGRYVFRTDDGLDWNLIYEQAVDPSDLSVGYYGSFYDLTNQTQTIINTPKPIQVGQTLESNGIQIVDGEKIYFEHNGVYNIQYSVQFANFGNTVEDVQIWLCKNDVYEPASNSVFSVPAKHAGVHGHLIGSVNYMLTMQTGDYVRLLWSVNHLDVQIETILDGGVPDSPGIILTVQQVTNVQQATTQISESLVSDQTAEGITVMKTAGENLVFGDIVYFKSDGKAWKANARVAGTYPAVAMATETIVQNAVGTFLLNGTARDDSWNWTIGGMIYLSTTSGQIVQTTPSVIDDAVQVLGVCHPDTKTIYFNPSLDYITLTEFDDYIEVSTTYNVLTTNYTINCTANSFSVTLPSAVNIEGKVFVIKNTGNGLITVNTTSSQLIDGNLTIVLAYADSLTIQSTNSGWIIL